MEFKVNLHFHTKEDPNDYVEYSLKEGIDHAEELGFNALAVTCHRHYAWNEEIAKYAESKGILLIPGAELSVDEDPLKRGKHVVLLNGDEDSAHIETFEELKEYKKMHPDILIMAAHPYFYGNFSLGNFLEKYIELFDVIEHSWFYSKMFNRNKKAIEMAEKYEKPLVTTSDTHFLKDNHMNRNYAVVEAEEKSVSAILDAIKEGRFKNVTQPSSFWKHMVFDQGGYFLKHYFKKKEMRDKRLKEKKTRNN